MNTELARFNMIEQQIRPWDVLNPAVLQLLSSINREDFVPSQHRALAFVDTQIPLLGAAAHGGACMLEPKVEARLLQELKLQPADRVLEIGTGSGFMAALMAGLAAQVTTLEVRPDLAQTARDNLKAAGLASRVTVLDVEAAQGATGLPAQAPFDAIVLSGSVAAVPQSLLDQLAPGGRLIAIVGEEPIMRARLYTRGSSGIGSVDLFDTVAPRLHGFVHTSRFVF